MSGRILGELRFAGFPFAAFGGALCQGQTRNVSEDHALLSPQGANLGGNGTTDFNRPDRPRRSRADTGIGSGLPTIGVGENDGREEATLTLKPLRTHNCFARSPYPKMLRSQPEAPANAILFGTRCHQKTSLTTQKYVRVLIENSLSPRGFSLSERIKGRA